MTDKVFLLATLLTVLGSVSQEGSSASSYAELPEELQTQGAPAVLKLDNIQPSDLFKTEPKVFTPQDAEDLQAIVANKFNIIIDIRDSEPMFIFDQLHISFDQKINQKGFERRLAGFKKRNLALIKRAEQSDVPLVLSQNAASAAKAQNTHLDVDLDPDSGPDSGSESRPQTTSDPQEARARLKKVIQAKAKARNTGQKGKNPKRGGKRR